MGRRETRGRLHTIKQPKRSRSTTKEGSRAMAMDSTLSPPLPPHVVALPMPLYGHYNPLFHLSCLLASDRRNLTITFVTLDRFMPSLQHQLLQDHAHLVGRVRLLGIDDGLPANLSFSVSQMSMVRKACYRILELFPSLMEKLQRAASPPVTCILSDSLLAWTQDVADSFHVPRIALWISSVAECAVIANAPDLLANGFLPFKDDENPLLAVPISLACLPPLYRCDFPSFLQLSDSSEYLFQFILTVGRRLREAALVIANSTYELERPVVESMKNICNILPVGPMLLLGCKQNSAPGLHPQPKTDEDARCLQWLDRQRPSSVLYLAFGSGACAELTPNQVDELSQGLEESGVPFLWAFRHDLAGNAASAGSLIEAIEKRNEGKGLVVPWAPQRQVLEHPSTGAFLTHCGWNSTQEGICAGVPMLCWPFGTDQFLHAKLIAEQWRVGFRLECGCDGVIEKGEISRKVRHVMASEEAKAARERVRLLGEGVRGAASEGGSSYSNMEELLHRICDANIN